MFRLLFAFVMMVATAAEAAPDAGNPPSDGGAEPPAPLRVAVPPELGPTFAELAEAWARAGNPPVEIIGAAPSLLVERIGDRKIDLFAGGSRALTADAGPCDAKSEQRFARGRIAVWTRAGTPPTLGELADPRWKKIALGEPNLLPYGGAANQALEHAGLLTQLMPRLVYAPDTTAALAMARDGRADVALVALVLVAGDRAHYTIVSSDLYTPIEETLIVCTRDAGRAAQAHTFERFVISPRGVAILKRHALDP